MNRPEVVGSHRARDSMVSLIHSGGHPLIFHSSRPYSIFLGSHSSGPQLDHLWNNTKPSSSPHLLLVPNIRDFSLHVSQDDAPLSSLEAQDVGPPNSKAESDFVDKRRLEEQFAVLNTGIHECRSCGYRYDQGVGDAAYPIPPGLDFAKLPDDWRCPTCGAAQSFFVSKSVEIAGFAQNQQFGLGGNTLTSGQKALLIYGSLFLAFLLFLSGYFIQ